MPGQSRRAFLQGSGVLAAAACSHVLLTPALARAQTRGTVVAPQGTTLERTLRPTGGGAYRRLTDGPGWPLVTRDDLAEPRRGRDARREALASVVHLTDIHVVDTQTPTRVEFLDRYADPDSTGVTFFTSAWRAQETLVGHVADAMVRTVNEVGRGPVTGRAFDVAVSTGDNTDNQQLNEVTWMIGLLDGGRPLAINSGDPDRYEGVQDDAERFFDPAYWHPNGDNPDDNYTQLGFPRYDGLLDAAIVPFTPVGIDTPWFSVYGNHDGLLQGNAPRNPVFERYSTAEPGLKLYSTPGLSQTDAERIAEAFEDGDASVLTHPQLRARPVTGDADRRFVSPREWVERHLASPARPGPVGHGFTADNREQATLYYTFDISDEVLGISLDTVNRGGQSSGSIGQEQLDWLEQRLVEVHGRYRDTDGSRRSTDNGDRLVVLFSHHGLPSLDNPTPDPDKPDDARRQADEVEAFLHRFPNVIAWVNGHSHHNRIFARPDPDGQTGGFWEINTAAHVDYPQHARLVEVADNRDGTLSILTTMIDHAGPPRAREAAPDVPTLAAISRELALNDPQHDPASERGTDTDRNTELLLTAPFDLRGGPRRREGAARERDAVTDPAPSRAPVAAGPILPATGGGLGATAVGAALAGSLALRSRRPR